MLSIIALRKPINLKEFILMFMAAIYPLAVIPGPLNQFSGQRYLLLAVISLVALYLVVREKKAPAKKILPALGLFLLFASISTVLSADIARAWIGHSYRYTGLTTYLFCAVLFFLAGQFQSPGKIVQVMVFGAVAVSAIALLQYFGVDLFYYSDYVIFERGKGGYGTMGNANWFGTYAVFILPAALILFITRRKGLWLGCAAVIFAGLLVSLTRGAWLACAVSLIIIFIFCRKNEKQRKLLFIAIAVLVVVALILLPTRNWLIYRTAFSIPDQLAAASRLEDRAASGRIYIWKETLNRFMENWAFGIGPDHLQIKTPSGRIVNKAHNIYLEIAATMGIFALLSYLAFISFFLRRWKNIDDFLFFIMICTYLVQGFSNNDVIMVMPLFWIVLGLSYAQRDISSRIAPAGVIHGNDAGK